MSSCYCSIGRAKIERTGAGMTASFPLTDFQIISLNSTSGARSASEKSNSVERLAPGASPGFLSVSDTLARLAVYGAGSMLSPKLANKEQRPHRTGSAAADRG